MSPRPALGPELAEQVAWEIQARTGSADVSFLPTVDALLYTARPEGPWTPFSSTTDLVQGIHESSPDTARKLVRTRIWSTREPDPLSLGMVKVAATRLVGGVAPRDRGLALPLPLRAVEYRPTPALEAPPVTPPADPGDEAAWLDAAGALVDRDDPRPLRERDRRVAAILVSREGRLLGASVNTNGRNRTLHAELNVLARRWLATGERLPPGTRLYVTLRPCKMCAGLIWLLAASPGDVRVVYARDDPGPGARNTVLEEGTDMRRRFARTPSELAVRCLFRCGRE